MRPRLLVFVLLALCVLLPRTARADTALWFAQMSRLHVEGGPTLLRHEVDAVCGEAGELRCRTVVRWTLPPSDTPRDAVVYLLLAQVHAVRIDGSPAQHVVDQGPEPEVDFDTGIRRVRVVLPPSEGPTVLTLDATITMRRDGPRCAFATSWPLAEQRHILQTPGLMRLDFDTELGSEDDPPVAPFEGEIEYTLDTPREWRVEGERGERRDERRISRGTTAQPRISAVDRVLLHGVVVGAGLRMRGKDKRPWLRGGWEVSAIPMLVHTLAMESDLQRFSVVPSTEIGTAGWLFLPSLSAGVGVPLRVYPEVRPGVRVFGGLSFPFVSVVGGYDAFWAMRGRPTEHIGHVGLQFSL